MKGCSGTGGQLSHGFFGNFAFFYSSFVASTLGDAFRLLAVNVWIFQATEGSTTDRLILVLLGNVPGLLLGGLSGVVADRLDKARILMTANLLRALVSAGLVLCALYTQPYAALGLVAVGNALGVFFASSAFSLIPRLVGKENIPRANGLMDTTQWLVQIIGPSLAALTLATLGAPVAFAVDAACFLVSAALLLALGGHLRREVTPAAASADEDTQRGSMRADFVDGVRLILRTPQVAALLLSSYGVTFLVAATQFTLIFLVLDTLQGSATTLGFIYSLNGAVAVGAAALTTVLVPRLSLVRMLQISILGLCISQVVMGLAPTLWVLAVGVVISALANAPYNVAVTSLYMQVVPEKFLGRVEGVDSTLDSAVTITAFVVATAVVSAFGPGAMMVLSAVVALPALVVAFRKLRGSAPA